MFELSDGLFILGYELGLALVFRLIVQLVRRDKDLEREFEGYYFLRWAVGGATLGQIGLVIMLCSLFWTRQALAVGFTALLGFPGWILAVGIIQRGFYRRYNRISNVIPRLERLGPAERIALLESLPPKVFSQLPGDYRVVSWEEYKH